MLPVMPCLSVMVGGLIFPGSLPITTSLSLEA